MNVGRLFWKFFLIIFLAQLTSTVGTGVAFWVRHQSQDSEQDKYAGFAGAYQRTSIKFAHEYMQTEGVKGLVRYLEDARNRFGLNIYALDDTQSDVLQRSLPRHFQDERGELKKYITDHGVNVATRDGQTLLLIDERSLAGGFGPPPGGKPSRGIPGLPLMPITLGFLASLLFAGLLAWYFSKPIRKLRMAFEAAKEGELDKRPGRDMGGRSDELADLARQFDQMADRLDALIHSQRRLLHDVSHEMRSPLARQQAAIDLARQQPEQAVLSMERLERELNRMDALVGELLALSRLEAGVMTPFDTEVSLSALLSEIVEDARFEAESQHKHIVFEELVQADIYGDYELLRRAIENVVRNAIKHSLGESPVEICTRLAGDNGWVEIIVCDSGAGVDASELESIFEPFYRAREDNDGQGYGLGLAIASRVIIAHGGKILAENRAAGGLCVVIKLPLIDAGVGRHRLE